LLQTVEFQMKKHGKDFNELEHLPPVKVIIADAQVRQRISFAVPFDTAKLMNLPRQARDEET
jgi:hypothetical protein